MVSRAALIADLKKRKVKGSLVACHAVCPAKPGSHLITRISPVFYPVWSDQMFIKKYDYT